ncbi:uncharacterized protein LRP34_002925 [Phaethornis superciliosus]
MPRVQGHCREVVGDTAGSGGWPCRRPLRGARDLRAVCAVAVRLRQRLGGGGQRERSARPGVSGRGIREYKVKVKMRLVVAMMMMMMMPHAAGAMPAACTLLLLLGLGLVPTAGSLPLASPRRVPPPPSASSRSCLGRPCSPPAVGHAGSPVIEFNHQARGLDLQMRTSDSLVDGVELVTMLARSRVASSPLPARHDAVSVTSGATEHIGPPTSSENVTSAGAGPPASPSDGTAAHLLGHNHLPASGSHHHAAGSHERGKRALASPNTPEAAERMSLGLAAMGTNSSKRMLSGHHRTWDVAGFDNTTGTVLLPSSVETHHPGTDNSSRLASVWVDVEPTNIPSTDTAASSPSTSGSGRGMLHPLPSTPIPKSPGQHQSSPQAPSTQTGANHIMLHARNVTGDSTSPLLSASPAMDGSSGAAGSSSMTAEHPRSGIQRAAPSSDAQPLASAQERFSRPSTEHWLSPPRLASESTAVALGSSYQSSNISAMQRRVSDFPTSISTTATKGGGRTLRSLPTSPSTSGTENTSSSDQIQSLGMSLGARGAVGRGATDLFLMGSLSASENTSTTFSINYEPKSIPAAEEGMLHSETHSADTPSMAVGTSGSPENGHTVTRGSATSSNPTSSLGKTSFLGTGTHHPYSSREAIDVPSPPGEPLNTTSLSASNNTSRGLNEA